MTSIINIESFQKTSDEKYWEEGTVEVTLRGTTKRVPAHRDHSNPDNVTAYGMTGRYQTGTKAWAAMVVCRRDKDGNLWDWVHFGRDDRASKFQKLNSLSFSN